MRILTVITFVLLSSSGFGYTAEAMKNFEDLQQEFYNYKQQMSSPNPTRTPPSSPSQRAPEPRTSPQSPSAPPAAPAPQADRAAPIPQSPPTGGGFEDTLYRNLETLQESFIYSCPKSADFDRTVEKTFYYVNPGIIKKVAWTSTEKGNTLITTFRIEYDSDYKVLQAHKNPKLLSTLDNKEKYTLEAIKKIVAQEVKPGMSDFEKVMAFHDFVILHAAYDEQAARNRNTAHPDVFTAYGLLANKKAVCDGYSKTMNLLLNFAGLESLIVSGTAKGAGHSWNKVNLGGDWYNIDTTFDDPVPDMAGAVHYDYFNLTDAQLRADHRWDEDKYPAATATRYNYFLYTGRAAVNYEHFRNVVTRFIEVDHPRILQVYLVQYDGSYSLDFIKDLGVDKFRYSMPRPGTSGVFTLFID